MSLNIMMDPKPTFPNLYHPVDTDMNRNFKGNAKYYTRTARPSKYYLIDFGLSTFQQDSRVGVAGQQRAPELSVDVPYNTYNVDIWILGRMFEIFVIWASRFFSLSCSLG